MGKLSVYLAEDHATVREGIKMLVNAQADMEVVGEAGDGEAAVREICEMKPDIAVLDISMPKMNGLKATQAIKKSCRATKVLNLTRHTDDAYLRQLIGAGSDGYVLKQSAPTELINAIRSVNQGGAYLDPSITQKVMGGFAGRRINLRGEVKGDLTDRESEVLRLIAWGYSNKEIAGRMELSVKTIEAHKANAMRKLDIGNRIDIVRYAILQGWLQDN